MRKQIANMITISRILCSICLLLCPASSIVFCIIYFLGGITDMVDGTIARKTNSVSELGAKLDSAADAIFVTVCFVKILPLIQLSAWIWIWIVIIAAIKIGSITWGYIRTKQLISLHTFLNKVTGLALFLFPLTLNYVELDYTSVTVCLLATLSAINEMYHMRNEKSIL